MGTYNLLQALAFTKQSNFKSRIVYKNRDVSSTIQIQRVKKYDISFFKKVPGSYYRVIMTSAPQYPPYSSLGKYGKKQFKRVHKYDVHLEFKGDMTLRNPNWKIRTGANTKPKKAPQNLIKSIYRETRKKWEKQSQRKFKESKKKQKEWLADKIKKHKERAKFLTSQDWDASTRGVFYDAYFRQYYALDHYQHLYGRLVDKRFPKETNPKLIVYLNKIELRLIEILLKRGSLKR